MAELVTLFVRPEAHDRGIGPALLDVFDAELRAAGEPAALVGVLPQDQPAVARCRAAGSRRVAHDPLCPATGAPAG